MDDQSQQGGSNFGPRRKVANGRSKGMLKAGKVYQKYQMNMKRSNLRNHNCNASDRRANVAKLRKTNPLKNSNVGPSNASVAKNSKSEYLLSSKDSRQPSVRNILPLKEMETVAPSVSKDDPNATSRGLDQSCHMKPKDRSSRNMESSGPPRFRVMDSLVHKAKDVDMSNLNKDALGSRSKGRSNLYQGECVNVGKDGAKSSKLVKKREVSRISNTPMESGLWIANEDYSNKEKGRHDTHGKFRREQPLLEEKADTHGGIGSDGVVQEDQTRRLRKKRRSIEENEDKENIGGDQRFMVVEHDEGVRQENLTSATIMKQGRSTKTNKDKVDGGCQNPVGVENDCEGSEQLGIHKSKKKRRRYIETDKYEDDMCDQHQARVEDGTGELAQVAISTHYVERQCYCCSKPIDKPIRSILFKIDGKEYKLVGHLSTKSCEKVWKLSFPKVVEVTKVPGLAVWPEMWKASKPTGDSIGLYFFPHELRHDEEDQLIKEVMDEDLALRAVIDEAEMLIFPSVLLPERHQTFQAKHYLWAAFQAKQDNCTVSVEQEEDKEKQHVSSQLDEVQSEESDQEMILMNGAKPLENLQLPAKSIREVETCCVQESTNMHLEREAPEESRPRDSLHQDVCTSASTAVATDAATIVANAATGRSEATSSATNTASCPANHGQTNPNMEARPGSSSVFGIVVRQTPDLDRKVQQFIQEMERDGVLVAVMQGEAIGAGQWPSNITTAEQ